MSVVLVALFAASGDCGKFSPENGSPKCEEGLQIGVGMMAVAAVVVLIIGYIVWWWLGRKTQQRRPSAAPADEADAG